MRGSYKVGSRGFLLLTPAEFVTSRSSELWCSKSKGVVGVVAGVICALQASPRLPGGSAHFCAKKGEATQSFASIRGKLYGT